jgi:hypothetical protein
MKLYEVELRKKNADFYMYEVLERMIVAEPHLLPTIRTFLSLHEDNKAYVIVTHVEAKI